MSAHLSVDDLADLPVGAVVLDAGRYYNERCAWTKTNDTAREISEAWASVQWATDRTGAELRDQFGPLTLLWDGGDA